MPIQIIHFNNYLQRTYNEFSFKHFNISRLSLHNESACLTICSPLKANEKSTESFDNAMLMIKEISKKVVDNLEETPPEFRPCQVELTFNLLLTMNGKAVITKSENEKNLKIMLMWKDKGKETEKEASEK